MSVCLRRSPSVLLLLPMHIASMRFDALPAAAAAHAARRLVLGLTSWIPHAIVPPCAVLYCLPQVRLLCAQHDALAARAAAVEAELAATIEEGGLQEVRRPIRV